jgi:Fe-S cluster assembly ATP-binding protein
MKLLEMDAAFLDRSVNEGFRRREEEKRILQMALLEPRLPPLDETDSASISTLRVVANGVTASSRPTTRWCSSHYQRMLNTSCPTSCVGGGRIIKTGGKAGGRLEARGYDWVKAA